MHTEHSLIEAVDPDIATKLASRRDLFHSARAKLGLLASAPVMLATVSSEAFGQGMPASVAEVLNFALTLEYLEDEFYRTALAQGVVPGRYQDVFGTISRHETEHVALLSNALGPAAAPKPHFDFTAGGRYRNVFRSFSTFTAVSQALEDTGVAAYKGQAPNLAGEGMLLTTALRIHSVEARHAAEVRLVRGQAPWTGAFDKPLSKAQVLAIAGPFIAGQS